MLNNNKGFTLIEMLIVLMIISVLIILIVPNLSGRSADVNEQGCEALVSLVQTQVDAFYIEKHKYPNDLDELVTEGYIKSEQKTCSNNQSITLDGNTVKSPYE